MTEATAVTPVPILSEKRIDDIWNSMPGGTPGWMKTFGYQHFATEIMNAVTLHFRSLIAEQFAAPADSSVRDLVLEEVARQWDGCEYETPGDAIDIGDAIRRMKKLLPKPAPVRQHSEALQSLRVGVEMDRHNLDDGDAKIGALDAAIEMLCAEPAVSAAPAELTAAKILSGWRDTFSTDNPFCPCDLKSFTKAVRWAERAMLAAPTQGAPQGYVLAPQEPSIAACIRGAAAADNAINGHVAAQVYAAMLHAQRHSAPAAAPPPAARQVMPAPMVVQAMPSVRNALLAYGLRPADREDAAVVAAVLAAHPAPAASQEAVSAGVIRQWIRDNEGLLNSGEFDAIDAALDRLLGRPGKSEQEIVDAFLERSGLYVTNDATREAALAEARYRALGEAKDAIFGLAKAWAGTSFYIEAARECVGAIHALMGSPAAPATKAARDAELAEARDAALEEVASWYEVWLSDEADVPASIRALIGRPATPDPDAIRMRGLIDQGILFAQPQGFDTQLGISHSDGDRLRFANGVQTRDVRKAIDAILTDSVPATVMPAVGSPARNPHPLGTAYNGWKRGYEGGTMDGFVDSDYARAYDEGKAARAAELPDLLETIQRMDQMAATCGIPTWSHLQQIVEKKAFVQVGPLSVEDLRLAGVVADQIESGTLFKSGIYPKAGLAEIVRKVIKAVPAAQLAKEFTSDDMAHLRRSRNRPPRPSTMSVRPSGAAPAAPTMPSDQAIASLAKQFDVHHGGFVGFAHTLLEKYGAPQAGQPSGDPGKVVDALRWTAAALQNPEIAEWWVVTIDGVGRSVGVILDMANAALEPVVAAGDSNDR